jgi:acyl-CoA hydrolase
MMLVQAATPNCGDLDRPLSPRRQEDRSHDPYGQDAAPGRRRQGMKLRESRSALDELRAGSRVYVGAATVEPLAFADALAADPDRAAGVEFIGSFVPGVNAFDYAGLHAQARLTTLLLPGCAQRSFREGRVRLLPLSYSAFADQLAHNPPDVAVVQVTPPDAQGRCSLGPCADFAPVVWAGARRRVAFVNPALPRPPGGWTLPADSIDVAVECDHAPIAIGAAAPGPEMARLVAHATALIDDGAAIQSGLGGAPAAVVAGLTDRRGLRVHSGMISDEVMDLAAAGALSDAESAVGVAIGSAELYRWLEGEPRFRFVSTPMTHGAAALLATPRLMAINSALEVDLFGQANLEWRGGGLTSGVGGAPDFIRGARLSPGGLSIIALPATAKGRSRIVSRLTSPSVSIPRSEIDVVVTEHGAARIRDLSLDERAEAILAVAAPEHRAELEAEWRELRRGF